MGIVQKEIDNLSFKPKLQKVIKDIYNIDCKFFNAFDSEDERYEFIKPHFSVWHRYEKETIKKYVREKGADRYLNDHDLVEGYDSISTDLKEDVLRIAKDKECNEDDVKEAYDLYKEYVHRFFKAL